MKELITQISEEIKKDLLPKLKLFDDFRVIKIYRERQDYLGYYKSGTYKRPIIKLNIPQLYSACQEYNVDLAEGIYSTILHELGHAIQDYNNKFFNEEKAEDFAYNYYNFGEILKI